MEPLTLVNPLDGVAVVVATPLEEHQLRAQGYSEPKPEPVAEPEPDLSATEPLGEPEPVQDDTPVKDVPAKSKR